MNPGLGDCETADVCSPEGQRVGLSKLRPRPRPRPLSLPSPQLSGSLWPNSLRPPSFCAFKLSLWRAPPPPPSHCSQRVRGRGGAALLPSFFSECQCHRAGPRGPQAGSRRPSSACFASPGTCSCLPRESAFVPLPTRTAPPLPQGRELLEGGDLVGPLGHRPGPSGPPSPPAQGEW